MLSKCDRIFNQISGILGIITGSFLFLILLPNPPLEGMFWYLSWAILSLLFGFLCLWSNYKNMDFVDYLIMKFKRKS